MVAEHITNLPSNKHSGRRSRTQMLVIHSAETPLADVYAASVTTNWLNRSDVQASINAFAGPDTLVRSVHTDYASWHASWANTISVGYEMTGYAAFNRDQWLTQAGLNMIDRLGREMAMDAEQYGIPLVYLTTDQVNQIANGNTYIKGIATHAQIDPANRTDPGRGFPYDVLLESIIRHSGVSPQADDITPIPIPIEEDFLSKEAEQNIMTAIASTEKGIREYIAAHMLHGTVSGGTWRPGVTMLAIENQRRINTANAKLAALEEVIKQLAGGQGVTIDYAKIEAIVEKTLAEGIEITGTITAKD